MIREPLTPAEVERLKQLLGGLDQLLGCFLARTERLPSTTSVTELMEWTRQQIATYDTPQVDQPSWGIWLTTENWAVVFGGHDWVGTREQAEERARVFSAKTQFLDAHYEARPYTGSDPASDKDLVREEAEFQRERANRAPGLTQREFLEAGVGMHLGDPAADIKGAMDEVSVEEFVRQANEAPAHVTPVHRARLLGLRGHCPDCGARPGEHCRGRA